MAKTGILLINLGTPEATSFWPMRRYLKEFLSDKRVIDRSGLVWWLVLNGIILTKRPKKSGRAYDKIWNRDLDESPLKTFTRAQAAKLASRFTDMPHVSVSWAMRYGKPSIAGALRKLKEDGCEKVLVFPLYPQFSGTTTGSVNDKLEVSLKALNWRPEISTVPPYFDEPAYIGALSQSIKAHHDELDWEPEVLIASFHGLPQAYIDKGDLYQNHCETTASLLRKALGQTDETLPIAYQSSSGRGVWLSPSLEDMVVSYAKKGVQNISVISPGFASDCVETLEEISIRAKQCFLEVGGRNFAFVPCLGASETAIDMIEAIARGRLARLDQASGIHSSASTVPFPAENKHANLKIEAVA